MSNANPWDCPRTRLHNIYTIHFQVVSTSIDLLKRYRHLESGCRTLGYFGRHPCFHFIAFALQLIIASFLIYNLIYVAIKQSLGITLSFYYYYSTSLGVCQPPILIIFTAFPLPSRRILTIQVYVGFCCFIVIILPDVSASTEIQMLADLANLRGASAVRTFTHFVFLPLLDDSNIS